MLLPIPRRYLGLGYMRKFLPILTGVCLSAPITGLASGHAQITTAYTYDVLGRLIEVDAPSGSDRIYCYDLVSNRIKVRSSGDCTGNPPPNNPPTANLDSGSANSTQFFVDIDLISNDTDPDGDTLTLSSIVQAPSLATYTILNATTVRLFPNGSTGNSSFTYEVSDGNGGTATGQVFFFIHCSGGFCP